MSPTQGVCRLFDTLRDYVARGEAPDEPDEAEDAAREPEALERVLEKWLEFAHVRGGG
jgi:hypothetical protein